jgi:hypothetical protein
VWCVGAATLAIRKTSVFIMSVTKTKTTQKRKKHAPEYKARVVLEIISGKRTVTEIARADKSPYYPPSLLD